MDSSTLTQKRRDQAIYSWYMNKAIFGNKQNAVADESTILQKDCGGYPLIFNYIVEGPNCCTNCNPTNLVGVSGSSYTLDEAVLISLDSLLDNIAVTNMGPTKSSRILYLWFMAVTSGYSWASSTGKISGTKDGWNWDAHYPQENTNDLFVWINHLLIEIMPTFVSGFNTTFLSEKETVIFGWTPDVQASEVSRVRAAGNWTDWLTAWNAWYLNRQSDGNVAAVATPSDSLLPNGSQSINVSTTTDDPNTFPAPSSWTPLIVGGARKNYYSYGWGDVVSTCLSGSEETTLLNAAQAFFPGTASSYNDDSARAIEVADLLNLSQQLTDVQKVTAEFWAGGPFTVSPPGMFVYFWGKYMIANLVAHNAGFDAFFYSGLDLAIHLFEAGRLVWALKKSNIQARPIQEIRRLYRGQTLIKYDGAQILGEAWIPYQAANFVTPPFPDFPSGHSAFSQSFANVMISWFGEQINGKAVVMTDLRLISPPLNQTQTATFGYFTFPTGQSEIQKQVVPSQDISLNWSTWQGMADSAGISRQYGGIHCTSAHTASVSLANNLHTNIVSNWGIIY
jgi:hypothetical protein